MDGGGSQLVQGGAGMADEAAGRVHGGVVVLEPALTEKIEYFSLLL